MWSGDSVQWSGAFDRLKHLVILNLGEVWTEERSATQPPKYRLKEVA